MFLDFSSSAIYRVEPFIAYKDGDSDSFALASDDMYMHAFKGALGINLNPTTPEIAGEYDYSDLIPDIGEIVISAYSLKDYGFDISIDDFDHAACSIDLWDVMDSTSGDDAAYYGVLSNIYSSLMYRASIQSREEAEAWGTPYLVCLQRLYIKPEYRNLGIGSFILEHIRELIRWKFNIDAAIVVGICVPDKDESEDMLEIQKNLFKKHGFIFDDSNGFGKWVY